MKGNPTHPIEGRPVLLLFDAPEPGPLQVLAQGEDLYY